MLKSLRLCRIFDIPIYVDLSWLLIFGWVLWVLVPMYRTEANVSVSLAWVSAVVTALVFFTGVLMHELGHALVARARGLTVDHVQLMFFGGVANIETEHRTPRTDLLLALAGPMVTLALGAGFALISRSLVVPPVVAMAVRFLALANIALGLFNLLPGFPLDGGRAFAALLWALLRDADLATLWVARIGQWLGMAFIGIGFWVALMRNLGGAILLAWVGLSLHHAARTAHYGARLRRLLRGYVVADLLQTASAMLPPDLSLEKAAETLWEQGSLWYLVGEGHQVLGVVNARRLRQVPRQEWPFHSLREILLPREDITPAAVDEPLADVFQRMIKENMAQLPVMGASGLVGILSRARIITFLRMREDMSVRD